MKPDMKIFDRMKKSLYILMVLSVITGCSLKEDSSLYLSPDNFCKTVEQCDAAVLSAYSQINSVFGYMFEIAVEGCTDLYSIQSGTQDAQLDISPANPRFGNTMWEYAYAGVRNANYAIYGIEHSGLPESETAALMAEARIMRAFWYYYLTSFFGDVPFYENYIRTVGDLEAVRRLPRMPAFDTRAKLVSELQECLDDLPQMRRCDIMNGDRQLQRMGAAAGYMILAKMAMWNKDWKSAKDALLKVQDMYGELSRYPLSDIPYSVKNTPESIYEVQHIYSPSGQKVYASLGAVTMPYPKHTDTSTGKVTFNGVEIGELGTDCIVWQPLRPNAFLSSGLYSRTGTDKRKNMTLVWDWVQPDGTKKSFSRAWSGPKFWCYGMYNNYDSNNYTILRYADALLMLAECHNELDESEEAIACLDQVKQRAGIGSYGSFRTKEKLREEIMNERGRELCGEFQRKFDLVRWDVWYQRTYEFTDYAVLRNNIRKCHRYYPIPDTQVALSGGVLDNKEYEEGL